MLREDISLQRIGAGSPGVVEMTTFMDTLPHFQFGIINPELEYNILI